MKKFNERETKTALRKAARILAVTSIQGDYPTTKAFCAFNGTVAPKGKRKNVHFAVAIVVTTNSRLANRFLDDFDHYTKVKPLTTTRISALKERAREAEE